MLYLLDLSQLFPYPRRKLVLLELRFELLLSRHIQILQLP